MLIFEFRNREFAQVKGTPSTDVYLQVNKEIGTLELCVGKGANLIETRTAERQARSISASGVVDLINKISKLISVSASGVASIGTVFTKLLSQAATAIGVASIGTVFTKLLSQAATAIGVASIGTVFTKLLSQAATALGVPALTSKIFKIIKATALGAASFSSDATNRITAAATALGVPALNKKVFSGLSVAATGVVDLVNKVFKIIKATALGVLTLATTKISGDAVVNMLSLPATALGVMALEAKITWAASGIVATGIPFCRALKNAVTVLIELVATGIATIQKKAIIGLSTTATGVLDLVNKVFKTIKATALGVLTFVAMETVGGLNMVVIAATALGVVALEAKITWAATGIVAVGVGSLKTLKNIIGVFVQRAAQGIASLPEVEIISDSLAGLKAVGVASVNSSIVFIYFLAFGLSAVSVPLITVTKIIPVGGVKTLQFVSARAKSIASFGDRTVFLLISVAATAVAVLTVPFISVTKFFGGSGLGHITSRSGRWARRKASWMRRS